MTLFSTTTLRVMTQHKYTQHDSSQHYDTQQNNVQHNDSLHNDTIHNEIQHNCNTRHAIFYCYGECHFAECHYAECHGTILIILNQNQTLVLRYTKQGHLL
jgi:hypothetical protein